MLQIMEIASFEKFLVDKIKVQGKTGEPPPPLLLLLPLFLAAFLLFCCAAAALRGMMCWLLHFMFFLSGSCAVCASSRTPTVLPLESGRPGWWQLGGSRWSEALPAVNSAAVGARQLWKGRTAALEAGSGRPVCHSTADPDAPQRSSIRIGAQPQHAVAAKLEGVAYPAVGQLSSAAADSWLNQGGWMLAGGAALASALTHMGCSWLS